MRKLILIVILSITSVSCSEDDENAITTNESVKPKIATFTQGDGSDYAVSYNGEMPSGIESSGSINANNNNPILFNALGNVTNFANESYQYNANNLINKVISNASEDICVLEYNGEKKLVRENLNIKTNSGTFVSKRDFEYTGGLVTLITEKTILYYTNSSPQTKESKYELSYDSKQNISQILQYEKNLSGNYIQDQKTTYEYDDKPNHWKEFFADKIFKSQFVVSENPEIYNKATIVFGNLAYYRIQYFSNNNIVKMRSEYIGGSTRTEQYQYTYNNENYIINRTINTTFDSSVLNTIYDSYTYK